MQRNVVLLLNIGDSLVMGVSRVHGCGRLQINKSYAYRQDDRGECWVCVWGEVRVCVGGVGCNIDLWCGWVA